MKNLKEKHRLWKYKNSPAFQSAMSAANKELERQNKYYEYKQKTSDKSLSIEERYAAFQEYMLYLKDNHTDLYNQIITNR